MLLLHGLASNSRIWDLTAPLLCERFRVVALDQRGHGLSSKPGSYSFSETTADTAELARQLGLERPVVVGHSWGASVALQYAVDHPAQVAGVALIDGGLYDMSHRMTWEQAEVLMRPPELDGIAIETFVENARRWPDLAELWSDQVQEIVLSNFEMREGRIYRSLPIPDHMRIVRALWEQETSTILARVQCQTLVVVAMKAAEDPQRAGWSERKQAAIDRAREMLPQARVVVMEDTIHDIPVQRPAELAAVIAEFAASVA
jgi:pimeloyl-ACP methyl ester carboxylesterase